MWMTLVAEKLTKQNYYTGRQFSAIAEFARKKWSGGFFVFDLPSGEGKTLFGVALYLLDKDHDPRQNMPSVLAEVNRNWKLFTAYGQKRLHIREYTNKSLRLNGVIISPRILFLSAQSS